jgi:hypothetical protein
MTTSSIITSLGIFTLLVYGLTKILEFYGIGINVYGSYITFYAFLLISIFVLPTGYNKSK